VTVLAGIAELSEEIDVPRAEQARDAATQRVNDLRAGRGGAGGGGEEIEVDVEVVEAQGSLERAELRLAVAAGEA
jgi:F0F1-type ATP synthase epsilon subunit